MSGTPVLSGVTQLANGDLLLAGKTYALKTLGETSASGQVPAGSAAFWTYAGICLALVLFAGIASGLTVGLLSIDSLNLSILQMEGSEADKKRAKKIAPLIKDHHLLLVTLLLANSAAMEALPIFLDRLVPSWLAVILSVSLVLAFGEVIPQALCTGPNRLAIGAGLAWFVWGLMGLLYIVAKPIALLLDWLLGEDHMTMYKRSELKALVSLHGAANGHGGHGGHGDGKEGDSHGKRPSQALLSDQVSMIHGALDLMNKTVADAMTPLADVYMLPEEGVMDADTMATIIARGFSRVPVYRTSPHNVKGLLLVKNLIPLDPEDCRPVSTLGRRYPIVLHPSVSLGDALNMFQQGHSHLALVTEQVEELRAVMRQQSEDASWNVVVQGLITIEDVLEELIQEEIEDEGDVDFEHVQRVITRRVGTDRAMNKFRASLARIRRRKQYAEAQGSSGQVALAIADGDAGATATTTTTTGAPAATRLTSVTDDDGEEKAASPAVAAAGGEVDENYHLLGDSAAASSTSYS